MRSRCSTGGRWRTGGRSAPANAKRGAIARRLFAYDNETFIVQSFRDAPATVGISIAGTELDLRNLVSEGMLRAARPAGSGQDGDAATDRTRFSLTIEPHTYQVFRIER